MLYTIRKILLALSYCCNSNLTFSAFCCCDKIPKKQFRRGKVYFGFQRSKPEIRWLCCF